MLIRELLPGELTNKPDGFAVAIAWPQTFCKQAGAWYDHLMNWMGINKSGYYQVGHAAVVLVESNTGRCHYFDFGRYHAPHGFGRVRNANTDHDLKVKTRAVVRENSIVNLREILAELLGNPSTHGTGHIFGSQIPIHFERAYQTAAALQDQDFIAYGPFKVGGTNCSRFVNKVLMAGCSGVKSKLALYFPWMLTPTPMWNLVALGNEIISVGKASDIDPQLIMQHGIQ